MKGSFIHIGTADVLKPIMFSRLRDAVSLNFDLLFTPLQQPAFKTNCFFLNANLFPRLFQRPALRYRHPDFGYFRVFSEASFAN